MKKPITKNMTHSVEWHARMTEIMFRGFCEDRGLGQLLGPSSVGHECGLDYVQFEYLQPTPLEKRHVDWLDEDVSTLFSCGHGTYWETLPWILAKGYLTASDNDSTYGEREWHKVTGTYVTSQFDAWAGHYSWPRNVFNNKCFYGVGFLVIACDRYLKKVFHRPWCATKEERVYHREGIVLTHVLVTFNRSIAQGHSRARYFLPRCEFRHGVHRCLRKYPDLRPSVWCDTVQNEGYEANGRPSELPVSDTHNYDAVCPDLIDDGPIDRRSSDSASGNATGNVGHADEVGDYDFDSESQHSMSSNDSLDDVSHASAWTRSTVFKSGYDMYIEVFSEIGN